MAAALRAASAVAARAASPIATSAARLTAAAVTPVATATTAHPAFDMNIRFDGLRALVTGASKGIGHATTLALADLGAEVVAVSRSPLEPETAARKNVTHIALDMEKLEDIGPALANMGDIDLLVNNAGIAFLGDFISHDLIETERVMRVNATSVMAVSQIVAKNMLERKVAGAIVNVSSQGSQVGLDEHAAYCMSKGALDQLTRTMALELGRQGIRVNAVNPTVVLTAMGRKAWSDPVKAAPMLARIPLGRFAEEVDVVNVIIFLLSQRAGMINGACVPVEGGFWAT